jgi:hypothetical protein
VLLPIDILRVCIHFQLETSHGCSVLQYATLPRAAIPHHFQRPTGSLACFTTSHLAALAQVLAESSRYKSSKTREQPNYQPTIRRTFSNHILATMKLTSSILSLAALFSVASATPTPSTQIVRSNSFYGNPTTSLNNVACSDGKNGLITKGFTTFSSLRTFPFVGAAFNVEHWNSTECGSCWELTYGSETIYLTAIDTVSDGFDVSPQAMNALTNGQQLDSINVQATEVAQNFCF